MNTTTLVGNLTRDPQIKFTDSGNAVLTFSIAVNRRFQKNKEWQEEAHYFDVVAYGELAENAGNSITKGSRVIVCGRLAYQSYTDKNNEKRTKIEVVADEIGISTRFAAVLSMGKVVESMPF